MKKEEKNRKKTSEEAVASSDPQMGLEEDARVPTSKRKSDHQGDEGRVPNQEGGSSSSQVASPEPGIVLPSMSPGPKVKNKFGEKKRSGQDLADRGRAP